MWKLCQFDFRIKETSLKYRIFMGIPVKCETKFTEKKRNLPRFVSFRFAFYRYPSWNWFILGGPLDWFSVFSIVSTLDDDGFWVVDEEPSLENDGPGTAWSAVPSGAFAVWFFYIIWRFLSFGSASLCCLCFICWLSLPLRWLHLLLVGWCRRIAKKKTQSCFKNVSRQLHAGAV
jgi:hypothetical protein